MILFLNFAPIEFMGGAEKWMNDTAKILSKHEETFLISVDSSIANLYGMVVLKRKFERRMAKDILHKKNMSLRIEHFIPLTQKWRNAKKQFSDARLIYSKYELLEMAIIFYFSGLPGLKKTIAGIHSPFLYKTPRSFFDRLHNKLYRSSLNKKVMQKTKRIHVLNKNDQIIMTNRLKLDNSVHVPNSVDIPKNDYQELSDRRLQVLYVGELSERKGTDILVNIIKNSPEYSFTVVGDGPYNEIVRGLESITTNLTYTGHVDSQTLNGLYSRHDVLVLPSRAESMSLALLEALSHGLTIVNSKESSLGLPEDIEFSCRVLKDYLGALGQISRTKKTSKLNRKRIRTYFIDNFSPQKINPQLFNKVFGVKL